MPIGVALDAGGAGTAGEWIRAAQPTFPCLIDEHHVVADLYGMTNVPSAVWIDERGHVARATENCGSSDAWRFSLDRDTGELPPKAAADAAARQRVYFDAVRDWGRRGSKSKHVLGSDAGRSGPAPLQGDEARAAACFRLATHLLERGSRARARHWLREAASLAPRSWRIKRELWTLDDPGNLFAGDFWRDVDALGDELYYEPPAIEGMPPQATRDGAQLDG